MRTAEEIYESNVQYERNDVSESFKASILSAIITAQKEAIEECANVAIIKNEYGEEIELVNNYEYDGINIKMNAGSKREMRFVVDKQSILSLINELK